MVSTRCTSPPGSGTAGRSSASSETSIVARRKPWRAMSQPDPASERLTRVLGTPELSWLVERIRGRIARGVPLDGVVTLTGATAQQRQAAARLLGRPPGRGASPSAPLPAVDAALWASGLADGLRGAGEALGGAVTDL